ncbi:hypothetical protein M406DRAFT_52851 [Cryphonectria parasitica EP155]|uniref:Uncharacterized protein n=1 Tax=Cryphonectria parasitica (strain ATCC 38755 / EP155) TaxID=660469 RepID=A0A9P4XSZ1_CRYP1|nr:uncharacterized protein M406DRAFT_52851 [Cryphonectria parasitica EP155]KAF3760394.1 hypothetical protein M406DRAFT_52851 [Cryphonectria parasitica EP155]
MAETIGLIADMFGIVSGFTDLLQASDSSSSSSSSTNPNTATFRIGVGANLDGHTGLGGDLPDARNFGVEGSFLGIVADPDSVRVHVRVIMLPACLQAFYTLFSANDDAICLAYAFMTMAGQEAGQSYGLDGTFGSYCGASWYLSEVVVPGTNYMPKCMWIDENCSQPATGFQVNWVDMSSQNMKANGTAAQNMCNTPSFKVYTDKDPKSITYWSNGDDPSSRTSTKRSLADKFSEILVISDHAEHRAEELCNSTTSAGPGFVNPEQKWFCDMTNKILHPVCGNTPTGDNSTLLTHSGSPTCFDVDSKQLRGAGVKKRSTPSNVQDWRKSL